MPYIRHESGEATELRNSQLLGDDSPLEFDEDGYAYVDDVRTAEKLLAMHRHIERGGSGPDGSADVEELPEPTDLSLDTSEAEALPFNPESHTIDELEAKLDDVDDEAALKALRNLEAEQKDRDGATEAIDDRLDELED
jgi:hypothetical protein